MNDLKQDFADVTETYRQLIMVCAEALKPNKTQEQRDRVRNALLRYLEDGDGGAPQPDGRG